MTIISVEGGSLKERRAFAEKLAPALTDYFTGIIELAAPVRLLAESDKNPLTLLGLMGIPSAQARIVAESILEARKTLKDAAERRRYIGRQIGLEHVWGEILRQQSKGQMTIVPDLFGDYLDIADIRIDIRYGIDASVEIIDQEIEF